MLTSKYVISGQLINHLDDVLLVEIGEDCRRRLLGALTLLIWIDHVLVWEDGIVASDLLLEVAVGRGLLKMRGRLWGSSRRHERGVLAAGSGEVKSLAAAESAALVRLIFKDWHLLLSVRVRWALAVGLDGLCALAQHDFVNVVSDHLWEFTHLRRCNNQTYKQFMLTKLVLKGKAKLPVASLNPTIWDSGSPIEKQSASVNS